MGSIDPETFDRAFTEWLESKRLFREAALHVLDFEDKWGPERAAEPNHAKLMQYLLEGHSLAGHQLIQSVSHLLRLSDSSVLPRHIPIPDDAPPIEIKAALRSLRLNVEHMKLQYQSMESIIAHGEREIVQLQCFLETHDPPHRFMHSGNH